MRIVTILLIFFWTSGVMAEPSNTQSSEICSDENVDEQWFTPEGEILYQVFRSAGFDQVCHVKPLILCASLCECAVIGFQFLLESTHPDFIETLKEEQIKFFQEYQDILECSLS